MSWPHLLMYVQEYTPTSYMSLARWNEYKE